MGTLSKSLLSHEKAHEICQKTLSLNNFDIAASYYNAGCVYLKMHQHSQAILFDESAVNSAQRSFPSNHHFLRLYREKVNFVGNEF
jgi:hypothetical protein